MDQWLHFSLQPTTPTPGDSSGLFTHRTEWEELQQHPNRGTKYQASSPMLLTQLKNLIRRGDTDDLDWLSIASSFTAHWSIFGGARKIHEGAAFCLINFFPGQTWREVVAESPACWCSKQSTLKQPFGFCWIFWFVFFGWEHTDGTTPNANLLVWCHCCLGWFYFIMGIFSFPLLLNPDQPPFFKYNFVQDLKSFQLKILAFGILVMSLLDTKFMLKVLSLHIYICLYSGDDLSKSCFQWF